MISSSALCTWINYFMCAYICKHVCIHMCVCVCMYVYRYKHKFREASGTCLAHMMVRKWRWHDLPHMPWFFTGVTAFLARQSMDVGRDDTLCAPTCIRYKYKFVYVLELNERILLLWACEVVLASSSLTLMLCLVWCIHGAHVCKCTK